MTTLSAGQECKAADLAEHRRFCMLACEYTRKNKKVTIATGLRLDGTHFVALGIMGENKKRAQFEAPRGIKRDELFQLLDDAAGIKPAAADDEWDW